MLTANSKDISRPPMGYEEVKRRLEKILNDAGQTAFKPFENGLVYPATGASVAVPFASAAPAPPPHPGYNIPGVVAKKQQKEEIGHVVRNPANAKVARGAVCLIFNKRSCTRTSTTGGCKNEGGREFLHICATVKHKDRRGTPTLCGENHSAQVCLRKK